MAGWEPMPQESAGIMSCGGIECRKHSLIGRWQQCKKSESGLLIGLRSEDGIEMSIARDAIRVKGRKEPWLAVTHMDGNANRLKCAAWVYQLIKEGKFESHRTEEL